jgi:starch synthase
MRTIAAEGRLSGILNGLDNSWDPGADRNLPYHFDFQDLSGKRALADLVRTGLCLKPSEGPLFGIVSRLDYQKGLDVVAAVAEDIVGRGGQLAILGLGDPQIEHMLGRLARGQRDHIAFLNGFNEAMARRIIGASDFCLMPSRFEPCGLVQMQAQRYGSLPIAHATGGLVDTIEDGATGFLFTDYSADGLHEACQRALGIYAEPILLDKLRRAAMRRRFPWSTAAEQYESLYCRSIDQPAL